MTPILIKGFLFDCDGVLVDSEPYIIGAELELLRAFGVDMDETSYHKQIKGMKLDDKRIAFLEMLPEGASASAFVKRLQNIHDEEHHNINKSHIMPGVITLLDFLKAHKIPMAVCSNSRGFNLRGKMENTGLGQYFGEHIYSYEDAKGVSKPAPDLYLLGAKNIGVSADQCGVVDDSANGVKAGYNAGALTFGFGDDRLYNAGAHRVVRDMQHLLQEIQYHMGYRPQLPHEPMPTFEPI